MPKNKAFHIHDDVTLKERTKKTLCGWFSLLNKKKALKIATRRVYKLVKSINGLKELSIHGRAPGIDPVEVKNIKNNAVKRRNAGAVIRKTGRMATTVYALKKKSRSAKIY